MATAGDPSASTRQEPREPQDPQAALPHSGRIEAIVGPMFSEKTTKLVSRLRRASLANQACVLVKARRDTRYGGADIVAAHSEIRQGSTAASPECAPIRVVAAERLSEVDAREAVVGVDEGQFFPDLIERCELWAAQGRRVIVAALDANFRREPFGQVCELLARCEHFEKENGVCMVCKCRDSAFTRRRNDSTELVQIGGRELYESVCRQCYYAQ